LSLDTMTKLELESVESDEGTARSIIACGYVMPWHLLSVRAHTESLEWFPDYQQVRHNYIVGVCYSVDPKGIIRIGHLMSRSFEDYHFCT
jgi:hypothetical protein